MDHVAKSLAAEYMDLPDRGHFMERTFPELVKVVRSKCEAPAAIQPSAPAP